jgi:thiol-disulfide isomerase/thioredoxin
MKTIVITVIICLILTSCAAQPESSGDFTLRFNGDDIFGNSVTQDTIGGKDIYFIYLWATWCPPCIEGMPDLAAIVREYEDRVGFIGLLSDFDNKSGAVSIVQSAGVPESFIIMDAEEPTVKHLYDAVRTGFVPAAIVMTADGDFIPINKPYRAGLNRILEELEN